MVDYNSFFGQMDADGITLASDISDNTILDAEQISGAAASVGVKFMADAGKFLAAFSALYRGEDGGISKTTAYTFGAIGLAAVGAYLFSTKKSEDILKASTTTEPITGENISDAVSKLTEYVDKAKESGNAINITPTVTVNVDSGVPTVTPGAPSVTPVAPTVKLPDIIQIKGDNPEEFKIFKTVDTFLRRNQYFRKEINLSANDSIEEAAKIFSGAVEATPEEKNKSALVLRQVFNLFKENTPATELLNSNGLHYGKGSNALETSVNLLNEVSVRTAETMEKVVKTGEHVVNASEYLAATVENLSESAADLSGAVRDWSSRIKAISDTTKGIWDSTLGKWFNYKKENPVKATIILIAIGLTSKWLNTLSNEEINKLDKQDTPFTLKEKIKYGFLKILQKGTSFILSLLIYVHCLRVNLRNSYIDSHQ